MNVPDFSIAHTLMLLSLDDVRGTLLHGKKAKLHFALSGAMVVELQFAQRLVAVKAHGFRIIEGPVLSAPLQWAVQRLGTRTRPLKRVVNRLAVVGLPTSETVGSALLEDLMSTGVVEKKSDRFLMIPYRHRYPLDQDTEVEDTLRGDLVAYASSVDMRSPPVPMDGLLSLLRFLNLLDEVLGEALASRKEVEKRTEIVPIGETVAQAYKEYLVAMSVVAGS